MIFLREALSLGLFRIYVGFGVRITDKKKAKYKIFKDNKIIRKNFYSPANQYLDLLKNLKSHLRPAVYSHPIDSAKP